MPWKTDLIKVNKYSRPGLKLLDVKGIILHYTANPGAGAKSHVTYFGVSLPAQNELLPEAKRRYASAHIFVDKNEAILILPLNEVAFHANDKPSKVSKFIATASYYKGGNANLNTIGIEMCLEKDGSIHPDTLNRTIEVTTKLCKDFKLKEADIYRHYDITGKNCPAPWVANKQLFDNFKNSVKVKINDIVKLDPIPEEKIEEAMNMKMKDLVASGDLVRLETVFRQAKFEGFLSSDEWEKKIQDGSINVGEAVYVTALLDHRRYVKQKEMEAELKTLRELVAAGKE